MGRKRSVLDFMKQFVCDYVNALCLIRATPWTSGVHAGCDNLLSFTPVHVRSGRLWLLRHVIVWEWLHWNASHTALKLIVFLENEGNGREIVQARSTQRAAAWYLCLCSCTDAVFLKKKKHNFSHRYKMSDVNFIKWNFECCCTPKPPKQQHIDLPIVSVWVKKEPLFLQRM